MSGKRFGCGMAWIFEQVAGLVLAAEYKPFVNNEALTTSTVHAKKHERALIKPCLCYSCRASPKTEEEEGGRAQVRARPVVVPGMQRWEAAKTIWASVCGAHVEEKEEHADYLKRGERWREHEEQTQTWSGVFGWYWADGKY